MNKHDAKHLLEKYQKGNCTAEERELIEYWFHNFQRDTDFSPEEESMDQVHEEMWRNVRPASRLNGSKRFYLRGAAALFLIFACSFGAYLMLKTQKQSTLVAQIMPNDVAPGTNKAILTLADGKKIILSDTKSGNIARQYNTLISKTEDGGVAYQNDGTNDILAYNTVSVPRGGQYSLTLSDGTKVYLNAESALTYPVAFNGTERKVKLEGEAYFEVAHNKQNPFKVTTGVQTIEVLGTHFNVNSYSDNPQIKTTLLEGSIKVSTADHTLLLKPGQQSGTLNSPGQTEIILDKNVDIAKVVAWKNGLFQFNESSIKEVMQDAARWYDLKVIYDSNPPDIKITGQISRRVNLSGLLALMRFAGAKITVEGKTVTISN